MANETDTVTDRDRELFYKLVLMLKVGAYEQLGLMENPFTKQKRKRIKVARESIDMLNMLLRRMKLTPEERDALKGVLTELQTLFIKESSAEL